MTTAVDATIALVSLAEAKEYLKVTSAGDDAIISHLINAVSVWVQGYLKRDLVSQSRVEYYSGDGSNELILRCRPLISISSLYIDSLRAWSADALVDTADYILKKEQGIVQAFNLLYGFTCGQSNIKVTYTAGYVAASDGASGGVTAPSLVMPHDIRFAVKRLLEKNYRLGYTQRKLDTTSESIGGMNVTFDTSAIPKDVVAMLDGWEEKFGSPQFEYAD